MGKEIRGANISIHSDGAVWVCIIRWDGNEYYAKNYKAFDFDQKRTPAHLLRRGRQMQDAVLRKVQ